MVPIGALFIGPFIGMFFLDMSVILAMALIILMADIVLLYAGTKLFQRENILIKWK
jgi:hypothetical protein